VDRESETPILPVCIVAHECRNRLSIIIGNCDLALEKVPEDSDIAKRLSVIRDAASAIAAEFDQTECSLFDLRRANAVAR
jgi:hypothetical protein